MGVREDLRAFINQYSSPQYLDRIGTGAVSAIQNHIHTGNFAPLAPATVGFRGEGKPLEDRGGLLASITYKKEGREVVVGTKAPYARIQNAGGTITAKKQYLWIPGPGMRTRMRRHGFQIREVLDGLRSEGYKVYRKGRVVCYKKPSKRSQERVAFYLKKSVTIPKREFFYLTQAELDSLKE